MNPNNLAHTVMNQCHSLSSSSKSLFSKRQEQMEEEAENISGEW